MSNGVRLIFGDLLTRGGWLLAALMLLQLMIALLLLGFVNRFAAFSFAALMLLATVFPLRAPSKRLLATLPIDSAHTERLQWLFSGGLIALLATAANLAALATAAIIDSARLNPWRIALVLFVTPGLIGLFMTLRRWTVLGISADNQDRTPLLAALLYPPILIIFGQLLSHSTRWGLVAFVVSSAGWLALLLFLFSPSAYHRWIDRNVSRTATQPQRKTPANLWLGTAKYSFKWGAPFGVIFGLIAWIAPPRIDLSMIIAIPTLFFGLVFLQPIKVFRSLPLSLDRCASMLLAVFVAPPFATLLAYTGICLATDPAKTNPSFALVLPIVGLLAPIAPLLIRLATRGIRTRHYTFALFLGFTILTALRGNLVLDYFRTVPVAAHVLAVILLVIAHRWIRHELRTGTILYRHRSQLNY